MKPLPSILQVQWKNWVAQTVEKTIEEVNADRSVSNNNKNRQIVISLYEKGILILKMRSI